MSAIQSVTPTFNVISADRFMTDTQRGPAPSGPAEVYSRYAPHVFFVNSVRGFDRDALGREVSTPFASIDFAVGKCVANRGDVIFVLPGHVETVAAANGLDLDVAGISVVGVGVGDSRPKIKHTATASKTRVNANSVRIENVIFTGDIDNVTTVLEVNGKTDVNIINCEYRDVTGQCAIFFSGKNDSDRMTISGFTYTGDVAAGTTRGFQFDGCDDLVMENVTAVGNFSTSFVNFITTLSARVKLRNWYVWTNSSTDLIVLDTITGTTGMVANMNVMLQDNAANVTEAFTAATLHYFLPINIVNLAGEVAMSTNMTASTDA